MAIPQLSSFGVSDVEEESAHLSWEMESISDIFEKVTYYIISYNTGNETFTKDIVG